jgi:hypothetical protein
MVLKAIIRQRQQSLILFRLSESSSTRVHDIRRDQLLLAVVDANNFYLGLRSPWNHPFITVTAQFYNRLQLEADKKVTFYHLTLIIINLEIYYLNATQYEIPV